MTGAPSDGSWSAPAAAPRAGQGPSPAGGAPREEPSPTARLPPDATHNALPANQAASTGQRPYRLPLRLPDSSCRAASPYTTINDARHRPARAVRGDLAVQGPNARRGALLDRGRTQESMWFTEYNTTKVGRVSRSRHVMEFPLPKPTYGGTGIAGSAPGAVLVADPAGFIDKVSAASAVSRTRGTVRARPPVRHHPAPQRDRVAQRTHRLLRVLPPPAELPARSGTPSQTVTLPDPLSSEYVNGQSLAIRATPSGATLARRSIQEPIPTFPIAT